MRNSLVGAGLIAGFVIAAGSARTFSEPVYPPTVETSRSAAADLITHVTMVDGQQVVTVIDSRQHVVAVYHVERTSGAITLKSVRNITWDLQMNDYNTGDPLPQDIRSGLKR